MLFSFLHFASPIIARRIAYCAANAACVPAMISTVRMMVMMKMIYLFLMTGWLGAVIIPYRQTMIKCAQAKTRNISANIHDSLPF